MEMVSPFLSLSHPHKELKLENLNFNFLGEMRTKKIGGSHWQDVWIFFSVGKKIHMLVSEKITKQALFSEQYVSFKSPPPDF